MGLGALLLAGASGAAFAQSAPRASSPSSNPNQSSQGNAIAIAMPSYAAYMANYKMTQHGMAALQKRSMDQSTAAVIFQCEFEKMPAAGAGITPQHLTPHASAAEEQ